jgi:hypothetical protein
MYEMRYLLNVVTQFFFFRTFRVFRSYPLHNYSPILKNPVNPV